MATLEMVRLRSSLPTGRVTLRHAVPAFNPVLPDDLMTRIEDVLAAHDTAAHETSTTPQVGPVGERPEAETTAGKGGGAR